MTVPLQLLVIAILNVPKTLLITTKSTVTSSIAETFLRYILSTVSIAMFKYSARKQIVTITRDLQISY